MLLRSSIWGPPCTLEKPTEQTSYYVCVHASVECQLRYAPALTAVGNMHICFWGAGWSRRGGEGEGQGEWWGTMSEEVTTFPCNTQTYTPTAAKLKQKHSLMQP